MKADSFPAFCFGAALTAALVLGVVSCGANDERGLGDAPVGQWSDIAADVINMPDGYPNVATKCVPYQPGKRVYVVTHSKTDVAPVIIDDPACGTPVAR